MKYNDIDLQNYTGTTFDVYKDQEGYLFLKGRKDDMQIYFLGNVTPVLRFLKIVLKTSRLIQY